MEEGKRLGQGAAAFGLGEFATRESHGRHWSCAEVKLKRPSLPLASSGKVWME